MAQLIWKNDHTLEDYAMELARLSNGSGKILGKAVYAMADIVANAIRENIDEMDSSPDIEGIKAWKEGRKANLTSSEKKALQDGFGISTMQRTDGYYNVKLGFDGYDSVKTDSYPKGRPIVMIARSLESGSSVREKHPFIRPAVNSSKKAALEACQRIIEEEMKNQMGG